MTKHLGLKLVATAALMVAASQEARAGYGSTAYSYLSTGYSYAQKEYSARKSSAAYNAYYYAYYAQYYANLGNSSNNRNYFSYASQYAYNAYIYAQQTYNTYHDSNAYNAYSYLYNGYLNANYAYQYGPTAGGGSSGGGTSNPLLGTWLGSGWVSSGTAYKSITLTISSSDGRTASGYVNFTYKSYHSDGSATTFSGSGSYSGGSLSNSGVTGNVYGSFTDPFFPGQTVNKAYMVAVPNSNGTLGVNIDNIEFLCTSHSR